MCLVIIVVASKYSVATPYGYGIFHFRNWYFEVSQQIYYSYGFAKVIAKYIIATVDSYVSCYCI